jgi:hypothetical protein
MKYLLDLFFLLMIGKGVAKVVSPVRHNRFYQPLLPLKRYRTLLGALAENPGYSRLLGVGMVLVGVWMSRYLERMPLPSVER